MPASKGSFWRQCFRVALFMLVPVTIGSVAGLYPGFKVYQYVWYDARFCTTCHVHDYATVAWKNSIHGQTTTCHDCHHQRLRDYIKEGIIMVMHAPKFPKDLHHTPYVDTQICSACHVTDAADRSTITGPMAKEDIQKIPKVDRSALHAAHLSKQTDLTLLNSHDLTPNEKGLDGLRPNVQLERRLGPKRDIECADCHGGPTNRGHSFSAVDASCVRCHAPAHKTAVGQEFGCAACHFKEFLIPPKKPDKENDKENDKDSGKENHKESGKEEREFSK